MDSQQLGSLTIAQLKGVAYNLGLRKSGNKADLKARVQAYLQTADGRKRLALTASNGTEPVVLCVCGHAGRPGLQCSSCLTWQHASCMGAMGGMKNYECARCQMEQMDPYNPVLDFLMLPALLPPDYQHSFICPKRPPRCHVEIRCLPLDRKGFTHQWPAEASVIIDNSPTFTFMPQPAHLSRKRKDLPGELPLLSPGSHLLQIYKKKEDVNYAVAVVMVETSSAAEVLERLKVEKLDQAMGLKLVASYLSDTTDLATETLRLSLLCPLTHLKPDIPVRGTRCSHLQCFDLRSFVTLQETPKVNRWKCPVCKEHCARLVRDMYLESILQASGESDMVEFNQRAQYRLMPALNDESEGSDADSVKRPGETDEPLPVKRLRLQETLGWAEFASGRLSSKELYASPLYSSVATLILGALERAVGPKPVQRAGSLQSPIVLDDS